MTEHNRYLLNEYSCVSYLNSRHTVSLVKRKTDGKDFICRLADHRCLPIYEYLRSAQIPGTPQIFEIFPDDEGIVIIEEYISGQSLQDMLDSGIRFTENEVIKITLTICDVLEKLQSSDPPIIHRDIKPGNIERTADGKIYLLDFDSSKYANAESTKDTVLLGTPGYAAPEQFGFGSSGAATDFYAIGKMMISLITGDVSDTIPRCSLSEIIARCTKLDPTERYDSVETLRSDLNSIKYGTHISDTANRPGKRYLPFLPPGFRSHNMLHMVIAVIVDIFAIDFIYNLKFNSDVLPEIYYKISVFIMYLLIVAFDFNYMGSWRLVYKLSSMNIFLKFIVITIMNFVIFIVTVLLFFLIFNSPLMQLIT